MARAQALARTDLGAQIDPPLDFSEILENRQSLRVVNNVLKLNKDDSSKITHCIDFVDLTLYS